MEASNHPQDVPIVTPQPLTPRRRHVGKWLSLAVVAIVAAGVASFLVTDRSNNGQVQASPVATVSISNVGFEPQTIKVQKGERVTWVNQDVQPRHVVADPYPSGSSLRSLNSGEPLAEGESYTATFEKSGTFTYHDQLDPGGRKGTVIVE